MERTIIHDHQLYFRYAGPFKTPGKAERRVEDYFAFGEIDQSDKPLIKDNAVYLLCQ